MSPELLTERPPAPPAAPPAPRPRRRALLWGGLLLAGAALAAGVALRRPWQAAPATVEVQPRTLQETVDVSGVVSAEDGIVLRAEASGRVKARLVKEDQPVVAGTELLRIDDQLARLTLDQARTNAAAAVAQAEAAVASARATLAEATAEQQVNQVVLADQIHKADVQHAQAERDLARDAELADDGAISAQQLDARRQARDQAALDARIARGNLQKLQAGAQVLAARNGVAQAEAALAAARAQGERTVALARDGLARTHVLAPVDGRVTTWQVAPGDWLAAGAPIASFLDPNALRLKLPVDELDLPKLHVGQAVRIAFDAFPDEPFAGRITRIGRASETGDAGVQAFPVEASFADAGRRVRPGMNADAHVLVREVQHALALPLGAVRRENQRLVVTRLAPDGHQETVPIQAGVTTLTYLEVRQGLAAGDRVVMGAR